MRPRRFCRAMLRRARYCYGNKSVRRLSVSDVQLSWSRRLEYYEIYFLADYRRLLFSLQSADPNNTDLYSKGNTRNFDQCGGGVDSTQHRVVTYGFTFASAFIQSTDCESKIISIEESLVVRAKTRLIARFPATARLSCQLRCYS